jgi:hypothetical protein
MRHFVVAVDDLVIAVFFFAFFHRFRFRIFRGESHLLRIRRPCKYIHSRFDFRELPGFSAVRRNQIDLLLALRRPGDLSWAVGEKRDPLPVRRPGRVGARFFRSRQRVSISTGGVGNPQITLECVVLPIRSRHFIDHAFAIGRNLGVERALHLQRLIDRGRRRTQSIGYLCRLLGGK